MSQAIDDLADAVKSNTDVVQSAITLIGGLADQLDAASNTGDMSAVSDMAAQIRASAQALADAVAAGTPADPAAPAAPAPTDPAVDPAAPVVNPLAP